MHSRRPSGVLAVLLVILGLLIAAARAGAQAPPPCTGSCVGVTVDPDGDLISKVRNTGPYTAIFDLTNTGLVSATYTLTCSVTGGIGCVSVVPSSKTLGPDATASITVTYNVGSTGGQLTLSASGGGTDQGYYTITATAGPPFVTLAAPVLTSGVRALVRTRRPLLRATFATNGASIDTAATVLKWRGQVVTGLARHNRGLLEWEVDSAHGLAVGDSALVEVTACGTSGGCTTATRWAVLLNDQKPVLAFTGMPLEALGSVSGGPVGPGVSMSGAEVETGFTIPSYISMGVARSTGLVYSTRQSYPRAVINVDLELPWPAGTPDQVKLVLLDGVTRLDSLVLATPTCATGAVKRCRATLQGDFGASSLSAPTRKWLTVEASVTSGATVQMGSDSVEVVLVDRRTTRYGSGWWPAGISQIAAAGPDRLLIGPNGAATVYRGNGDSVYVPPPGVFTGLVKTGTGWELRPRGSTAKLVFDAQGRLKASVDQNGNRDSVAYVGTTDQIDRLVDPRTQSIVFAYNGSAKLTSITDPGGRQSKVTINGTTNQLTADSVSSPTTRGNRSTYVYQSYPGTNTVVLKKRIGVLTDTTLVVYDSTFRRRPKQVKLPQVPDQTGAMVTPVVIYTPYESRGTGVLASLDSVYLEVRNPRNFYTRSLLNRWGQPRVTWDVLGVLSRSAYTPDGLPLSSEGKHGDSSRVYLSYDAAWRPVRHYIVRAPGDTLRLDSLVYDLSSRVVKHIDARDQVDSATYDANGNVIATWDSAGVIGRTAYRTDGLPDSTLTPGASRYRVFTYDATLVNLLKVFDEAGGVAAIYARDGLGRASTVDQRVQVKSPDGSSTFWQWRRTQTYYNTANQADSTVLLRSVTCQTCITAPPSWSTATDTTRVALRYDRSGRDSLRLDARGKATAYVYDRLGRLLSRRPWTDSSMVKDSMLYDLAGNVKQTITRRGDVITADYDARNRDTLVVIPGVGTLRKLFAGPQDQLTKVWYDTPTDPIGGVNGEVRYGYDQRGRLRADTSFVDASPQVTSYSYDTFERPSTMVDRLGIWRTGYDKNRGYVDTLVTPFTDTVRVVRDAQGRLSSTFVHGTGVTFNRTTSWTNTNELNSLSHVVGTSPSYDAGHFDRLTAPDVDDPPGPTLGPTWSEKHGSAGAVDSLQDTLHYDGRERVRQWLAVKLGPHPLLVGSDSLDFDLAGNMTSPGSGEVYNTTTERLVSRTDAGTTRTYTYDRAGNQTGTTNAGVTWAYTYDALNRQVSATQSGVLIARYGYDVLGRRIAKRVYSSASGGTVGETRFVYHGQDVVYETTPAGAIGWSYAWGPGSDELVAADSGGQHYYAVRDRLGSVRGLVGRDGSWKFTERFRPYGTSLATMGTRVALRYRWTGREWDAELGWYFHRSRYYDPGQRRFVQEDPIEYSGGTNLYAYVAGRALEATDPSGMMMDDFLPPGGGGGGWRGVTLVAGWGSGRRWWRMMSSLPITLLHT
jgi:RHS repeat-associated protein